MTARAGDRWHQLRAGLALLALLVLVVLVVTSKRTRPPASADLPEAAGVVETPAGATEPPPPPSPTAEPASGQSSYVVPWSAAPARAPEASPTPEEPWAPPRRATPAPQPCVEYTWSVSDSPAVAGQILVEIRVRNRCGRVLQPLEVLFHAQGWRGGDAIYSAQGNLLEKIYPDSVRTVMVALPGSRSFYDRVEVTPINPPLR
jgi:hypothetical protein